MENLTDPPESANQGLYTPKRLRDRTNSNYLSQSSQKNSFRKASHKVTPKDRSKRVWKKVSKKVYNFEEIVAACSHDSSLLKSEEISKMLGRKSKIVDPLWRKTPQKLKSNTDELTKNFKSLLNKLAPTNAVSIQNKILVLLNPDSSEALSTQVLDKASVEGKYAETYAKLCVDISKNASYYRTDLLNSCQKMFESTANENGDFTDRKKVLGCVRFIGELFKARLIPPKIICSCCNYLFNLGSEDSTEGLCYLLSVCNALFHNGKYKETFHRYIVKLQNMADSLTTRLKFQVLDLTEKREIKTLAIQKADAPKMISNKNKTK